jgi:hypothetical protein
MLLFIWWLLTLPQDKLICNLWISQIPTPQALVQACGTDLIGEYRLDVLYHGQLVCTKPGAALRTIQQECNLGELSQYQIRIVKPNHQELLPCSVTMTTDATPSAEEIHRQCPNIEYSNTRSSTYELRFAGTRTDEPDEYTICKPPPVEQPVVIATSENYHLLAGKLIWWDLAKSNCPDGYSGVNPETYAATPCGMDGARAAMLDWQNGLDDSIIRAAREWHVPAALLKEIIARETQYWPWTGEDGEHGMIQITEDGAELVLFQYLPGYTRLTPGQRYEARLLWLRQLDCEPCTPQMAYDHAKQVMNLYAQSLAAYYCTYGNWDAAMRAWNINHELKSEG